MADTLSDAVIRLRLDTTQARKDADSLRTAGGGGSPSGPTRPTPGKGGGRVSPSGGGKPLFPPGAQVNFDPDTKTVTFGPPTSAQPGQSDIEDAPIPGAPVKGPTKPTAKRTKSSQRKVAKRSIRNEVRLARVEAQQAIGSLGTAIASIPGVELLGLGLAGSALTDQFGPGVAEGIAGSIRRSVGGEEGEGIAQMFDKIAAGVEANSAAITEVRSFLSALSAVRQTLGSEAQANELAAPGTQIDPEELLAIGQAQFRVTRALTQLNRRREFLEKQAHGRAAAGGGLDALFKASLAK